MGQLKGVQELELEVWKKWVQKEYKTVREIPPGLLRGVSQCLLKGYTKLTDEKDWGEKKKPSLKDGTVRVLHPKLSAYLWDETIELVFEARSHFPGVTKELMAEHYLVRNKKLTQEALTTVNDTWNAISGAVRGLDWGTVVPSVTYEEAQALVSAAAQKVVEAVQTDAGGVAQVSGDAGTAVGAADFALEDVPWSTYLAQVSDAVWGGEVAEKEA